jgi:hypothetical protein
VSVARHLPHARPVRLAAAALAATGLALAAGSPAEAATPAVRFTTWVADQPGTDRASNTYRNKEYIQIKNVGRTSVTIGGWRVQDRGAKGKAYTWQYIVPRGTVIKPGATITLRSGTGRNTSTTLYWQKSTYIWNNTGDDAVLRTSAGTLVQKCTYKPVPTGVKKCS